MWAERSFAVPSVSSEAYCAPAAGVQGWGAMFTWAVLLPGQGIALRASAKLK